MAQFGAVVPQEDLPEKIVNIATPKKTTNTIGSVVPKDDLPTTSPVVPKDDIPTGKESVDAASFLEKLKYGFESNIRLEKLANVLQARSPLSVDKYVGENLTEEQIKANQEAKMLREMKDDELNLSSLVAGTEPKTAVEKRLEYYRNKKKDYLDQAYSHLTPQEKESGAAVTGEILGSLYSPETFVPLEKLFKLKSGIQGITKFAGISGLWGAEYSVIDQIAETGKVDPETLAKDTVISAISGGTFKGGADILGKTYKFVTKSRPKKVDWTTLNKAEKIVEDVEYQTAQFISKGAKETDIPKLVKQKLKLSDDDFNKALATSTKKIKLPSTIDEANEIIAKRNYKAPSGILGGTRKIFRDFIVPIHTTLKRIAPKIANRLMRFEYNIHNKTAMYAKAIQPFFSKFNKLNKSIKRQLSKDMFEGNFDKVYSTLSKISPKMVDDFQQIRNVLDSLYREMTATGMKIQYRKNYIPRNIVDYAKFKNKLSEVLRDKLGINETIKVESKLDELLLKKQKEIGAKSIEDIPPEEASKVINNFFEGRMGAGSAAPRFTKDRTIKEVYDEILDYYDDPADALLNYIRGAVNTTEKRKFFGKNLSQLDDGFSFDIDNSIGNLVQTEGLGSRANEVRQLINARFGGGEQAVGKGSKFLKDVIYGSHLGNIESALVQVGDIGVSAYVNGFARSLVSFLRNVTGNSKITVQDLGLNNISAEISTLKGMSKLLDGTLKYSGFQLIDRMGKNTFLNSALSKATSLVKSNKGINELQKKYGTVFGNEFGGLISDLQNGKITDNVKYYLFSELSGVQPINLSQMPLKYLNMKGGRVLYALKSFTLKQLDLIRRTVIDEAAKGNFVKAGYNATRYLMLVTAGNTSVDQVRRLMNGKEVGIDEFKDDFANNVLKIIGSSRYVTDKLFASGRIDQTFIDTVTPPLDFIGYIAHDLYKESGLKDLIDPDDKLPSLKDKDRRKSIRYIPFFGRLWYQWFGGGLEDYQEKQWQEFKKGK